MKIKTSIYLVLCIVLLSACAKEEQFCTASDYIGIWNVETNACSINNSNQIKILEGSSSSRIKLILNSDTLDFLVFGCGATYAASSFLVEKEATLTMEGDKLMLDYQSQVAILGTFCFLEMSR